MSKAEIESKRLAWISFISLFGDFLTTFSVVKILYEKFGSYLTAGFGGVAVGSAATVFASFFLPQLKNKFKTKNLIVGSQILSCICVTLMLAGLRVFDIAQPAYFLILLFIQGIMERVFEASKECHSHAYSVETSNHLSIQSELLSGVYSAQFLGPIAAFLLLKVFSIEIPVLIDVLTFIIAVFLATKLEPGPQFEEKLSILNPVKYLFKNKKMAHLFILRTVMFWVPTSLFNLFIFEKAANENSFGIEFSGIIYSVIGLGAMLSSRIIRHFWVNNKSKDIRFFAFWANLGFCFVNYFIANLSGYFLLASYLVYGLFMGLNSVSTQTMRRYVCTKNQLPEIISIEQIFSFSIQSAIISLISIGAIRSFDYFKLSMSIIPAFFTMSAFSFILLFKRSDFRR